MSAKTKQKMQITATRPGFAIKSPFSQSGGEAELVVFVEVAATMASVEFGAAESVGC